MRKLWLLFAQTVTVGLGLWFVVAALRPQWVPVGPAPEPPAPRATSAPAALPSAPVLASSGA